MPSKWFRSQCKRLYDHQIVKSTSSPEEVKQIWCEAVDNVTSQQWKNYVKHTESVIFSACEFEKSIDASDVEPLIS